MKKTESLQIRISPEIKELLKKLAKKESRSMSDEIAHLVKLEAERLNV